MLDHGDDPSQVLIQHPPGKAPTSERPRVEYPNGFPCGLAPSRCPAHHRQTTLRYPGILAPAEQIRTKNSATAECCLRCVRISPGSSPWSVLGLGAPLTVRLGFRLCAARTHACPATRDVTDYRSGCCNRPSALLRCSCQFIAPCSAPGAPRAARGPAPAAPGPPPAPAARCLPPCPTSRPAAPRPAAPA